MKVAFKRSTSGRSQGENDGYVKIGMYVYAAETCCACVASHKSGLLSLHQGTVIPPICTFPGWSGGFFLSLTKRTKSPSHYKSISYKVSKYLATIPM